MISICNIENKGLLSVGHNQGICFFKTIDKLLPASSMWQEGFIVSLMYPALLKVLTVSLAHPDNTITPYTLLIQTNNKMKTQTHLTKR